MIRIENTEVIGWEHAIRGMRNPKNSWERSDTGFRGCSPNLKCEDCIGNNNHDLCNQIFAGDRLSIGPNDHKLMSALAAGGPVHAKYRRMIAVYLDITAPLYWWKEFDTYKVGTVANSCSTMHKIHAKEFTLEDFSTEHLMVSGTEQMMRTVKLLNDCRDAFVDYDNWDNNGFSKPTKKDLWWQMIQLLPSSYNQKRTVMLNYEVLVGMYEHRKNHKLDEWRGFCKWIESLPYSELITCAEKEKE